MDDGDSTSQSDTTKTTKQQDDNCVENGSSSNPGVCKVTHQGVNSGFVCQKCGARFTRRDNMLRHERRCRTCDKQEKFHTCQTCTKTS
ncbi:hypothetical protein ACF0H5_017561 [Mactra antiquata]